jgi:hypothetical protein
MRQVNTPISTSESGVQTQSLRPIPTLTATVTSTPTSTATPSPSPSPSPTDPVLAAFDMPRHPKRLVEITIAVKPDPAKSDTYDVSSSITLTVSSGDQLVAQIRDGAIQVTSDGFLTPAVHGAGIGLGNFDTQSFTPYLSVFTPSGASTSYSEVDTVDTVSYAPFILTWSAPPWAEPTDTFKLSLRTPQLDILGVKDAVPSTESVSEPFRSTLGRVKIAAG